MQRKWKTLGWEGPLLLVGALAAGAFVAANSCDGNQTGGLGTGKIGGTTGTGGSVATAVIDHDAFFKLGLTADAEERPRRIPEVAVTVARPDAALSP